MNESENKNVSEDNKLVTINQDLNEEDAIETENKEVDKVDAGHLEPGVICVSLSNRRALQRVVTHMFVQFFVFLLVLIDSIMTIVSLTDSGDEHAINQISIVILTFLVIEVLLRLTFMDFKPFFTDILCVFDFVVVVTCFIVEISFMDVRSDTTKWLGILVVLRLLRAIRVLTNLYRARRHVAKSAQGAVSGHRRRYQKGGFDLDISYITERLLAMGVPAVGKEELYRNPIDEVVDFFETKHKDKYRIYNSCPERKYPYEKFQNQVYEWFMYDHNPCPIHEIVDFCHHIHKWINDAEDEKKVAAVHCKGGKGRTGTLVCSYLLYAGIEGKKGKICTAADSMEFFAGRRTEADDGISDKVTVGVEARSQSRYIGYMAVLMKELSEKGKSCSELVAPKGPMRKILKIRVKGISIIMREFGIPTLEVGNGIYCKPRYPLYKGTTSDCQSNPNLHNGDEKYDYCDFVPAAPVEVQNDVQMAFYIESKEDDLFGYWWHTYFEEGEEVKEAIEHVDVDKADIRVLTFGYMFTDGIRWAIKKKKYKHVFPKHFEVQTFFQ